MICFCAERFHWRRIWQNPGELLLPGLADMATRALLYRRPAEPSTLLVKHGSQIYSIRLRRHRRARRYTLAHSSERPRSDPDHAAARHASPTPRISRSVTAAGSPRVSAVCRRRHRFFRAPWCRCAASRTGSCIAPASAARCGPETRDSGERILCVAGGPEHIDRRVHDYLKREVRHDLHKAAQAYAERLASRSSGCRSATSRAAGARAPRPARCRFPGG